MDLARLAFFCVVDFLASLRNICATFNFVHDIKLQSPNDIGRIFDTARLFETLEGNGLVVVSTIEGTDDNESGVGIALKFFEFANGVVDAEFDVIFVVRNNLKVINANDRSFGVGGAERTKESE